MQRYCLPITTQQRGAQRVIEAMAGKRAELFRFYLRDFREQRIKKADALGIIACNDNFPGWARTKAARMLRRIERNQPF
ncbi:hypothetical protein DRT11_23865 [Salmonella enterica subsp. enterica]|nr:hypothetical protein [Salmonella enterica subsp. enterica serovar Bareilly]